MVFAIQILSVLLVSVIIGGVVFLIVIPLFPGAIAALTNKPNKNRSEDPEEPYEVSHFGLFTAIAPKQVKIIEKEGDSFVTCLMNYNGHNFKGVCDPKIPVTDSEYWHVVSTTSGEYAGAPDAHPVMKPKGRRVFSPLSWIWYSWKMYVYGLTGLVFTGIYPFRRVRTYKLERALSDRQMKRDYSDHFRVEDFEYPIVVPEADTSDKMSVEFHLTVVAAVHNPYKAAYRTDNWGSRLNAAVHDRVTSYTRPRLLEDILSAKEGADTNELSKEIMKIGDSNVREEDQDPEIAHDTVISFGFSLKQVLVRDITPVLPTSEAKVRLTAEVYARIDATAERIRAEGDRDAKQIRAVGDAAQLQEQIQTVQRGGNVGLAVLAAEKDVRTAGAAGERAVIVLGGSGNTDPLQAAILQELKDQSLRRQLAGDE